MSYYVEYSPELKKRYPIRVKRNKNPTVTVAILLLAAVAAYISVQYGLVRYLIPGNQEVTAAAISQLVEQLASGEPIREAVITFCEEIVTNGA